MNNLGIVGGGLLGRMAAFILNESGYDITVFEQNSSSPPIGTQRAAAFSSAGMLSPLSEKESGGKEVFELGNRSMTLWPVLDELIKKTLGYGLELKIIGNIFVSQTQDLSFADRLFKKISYIPNTLTIDQLNDLEPSIDPKLKCWLIPNEGQVDPLLAMKNFYNSTIKNKSESFVKWNFNSKVKFISEGTVHTEKNESKFDWIFDFRGLGAKDLKIRGVRGEIFLLQPPKNFILNRPVRLIHPRVRIYVVPKLSGEVMVGATEIELEDISPVSVNSTIELLTAARSILPGLNEARILHSDVNLRPACNDNLPLFFSSKSISHVNGLFRHGWLLAPALLEKIFTDIGLKTSIS